VPLNPTRLFILLIIFSVAVVVQLTYFIVFNIAFSRASARKISVAETATFPISVIVCAHDEEDNLRELIPALLAQNHPEFEVIIVDDRSNDGTFDMLLEETRKDHRLRMVHVNRTPNHVNSKKYAITLGIKAARYEWIALTDADCRPEGAQWLRSLNAEFSPETSFVLGHSPYTKQPGFLNLFIRFESLITAIQYLSFAFLGNPYMGVGRNMAYRRSAFMEAKGFNQLLPITGGDDDLFVNRHANKTNTAVTILPSSQVTSIPKTSWKAFYRQKVRHLSVGKHYKAGHRILLGLFLLTWMLTWFAGIPLAIFSPLYLWVLGALIIRMLVLTITLRQLSKKLGQPFEVWGVIPLDFIYGFYYLVTGLVALFTRKVRWKK
jgi:cellulose synthase/poly-beta-1,6-N-acetylglucosamine synthase-like glycosyltransferase